MRYLISTLSIVILVFVLSFRGKNGEKSATDNDVITVDTKLTRVEALEEKSVQKESLTPVATLKDAQGLVTYAKTLVGIPYLYGSVDPTKGFDCSGFINHVSNHFGIKVPRSSVEFTNAGTPIPASHAEPGDLILFTGTDPSTMVVGHIGIITENTDGQIEFIHSSSGKANGVILSELKGYYETRFVKVIRIFPTGADKVVA